MGTQRAEICLIMVELGGDATVLTPPKQTAPHQSFPIPSTELQKSLLWRGDWGWEFMKKMRSTPSQGREKAKSFIFDVKVVCGIFM